MAPSTVDDLRELLERERTATGKGRIGDKTLQVLADLLGRPGVAAVDSITNLAAHSGVDPSTLTRLGKRLGFSGFGELQDIFRRHVADTQPFYSRRIQERIGEEWGDDSLGLMQQHARTECRKLFATVETLDPAGIERAAELLTSANHVYVLGLRATYALSHFLGAYLGTFRQNVGILGGPGFPLASELARIMDGDLLVALTFRPYTKAVVTAVEVAREAGIQVLAITDAGSPISVTEEEGVTVSIDQPFYFDSATAHFFIIQTILLAAARNLGPEAVDMAQRRERLYQALGIE